MGLKKRFEIFAFQAACYYTFCRKYDKKTIATKAPLEKKATRLQITKRPPYDFRRRTKICSADYEQNFSPDSPADLQILGIVPRPRFVILQNNRRTVYNRAQRIVSDKARYACNLGYQKVDVAY
jgi:hypothetical protein